MNTKTSQPIIINVAKWLREDRHAAFVGGRLLTRHDLRRSVKKDRRDGLKIMLYARPGTIVRHHGQKCLVSNKGKMLAFAAA